MKSRKQLVLLCSIMLSMGISSKAQAEDGPLLENLYFKSKKTVLEKNNLSFGYRLLSADSVLKNARFEQQVSRSTSIYNRNSFDRTKVMSNVVYDFEKVHGIKTYVGAGVGVMHISNTDDNKEESYTSPSYQVMTGMTYSSPKHPSLKFQLGYSYSDKLGSEEAGNDLHLKQDNFTDDGGHAISATVRYTF